MFGPRDQVPPGWTEYFFEIARTVASKSKDPSTKVGCVVVGPDHDIRSTGFNGIPRDVHDKSERMEQPAKYMWTAHAEENAVSHAARIGVSLKGCTAYVTHYPCAACTRMLIQSGINKVVCLPGETAMNPTGGEQRDIATQMFREAGVTLVRF